MKNIKPGEIRSCWDNGGKTVDRYTIVTEFPTENHCYDSLGLSSNPNSPMGFSQWALAMEGDHLGHRVAWEDLPQVIQAHIISRLT